ncbi:hypothetical protein [Kitasatospora sp. NPDC004531]
MDTCDEDLGENTDAWVEVELAASPEWGPGGTPAVHPEVLRDEPLAAAEWVSSYLTELPAGPVMRSMPEQRRSRLREAQLGRHGEGPDRILHFAWEGFNPKAVTGASGSR